MFIAEGLSYEREVIRIAYVGVEVMCVVGVGIGGGIREWLWVVSNQRKVSRNNPISKRD